MPQIVRIIVYSMCSGITVFFGGLSARVLERHAGRKEYELLMHISQAFGGGILIAAVAFVLIPAGIRELEILPLAGFFIAGIFCFCYLDLKTREKGGSFAQIMAMMTDFIPEAIAMGGVFALDIHLGLLLAVFIGLQNFPESFNAYTELKERNGSSAKTLWVLFLLSFSGVVAALLGNLFLSDLPRVIAGLMVFSGAGIIYLMFQDIAPDSKIVGRWAPAVFGALGFLVGVIGQKMLG